MRALATFEASRWFGETLQHAIVQVGALHLAWIIDDIKSQGDKTTGIERAMWRETLLRMIAPRMMAERDPFLAWRGTKLPEAKKRA